MHSMSSEVQLLDESNWSSMYEKENTLLDLVKFNNYILPLKNQSIC